MLPAASTATPLGLSDWAAIAGPPSPAKPRSPVPATVEMVPEGSTLRMRSILLICDVEVAGLVHGHVFGGAKLCLDCPSTVSGEAPLLSSGLARLAPGFSIEPTAERSSLRSASREGRPCLTGRPVGACVSRLRTSSRTSCARPLPASRERLRFSRTMQLYTEGPESVSRFQVRIRLRRRRHGSGAHQSAAICSVV